MSKAETASPKKRILTFDLMRGFFLISIILNHLQWYPNFLEWATYRGGLFVSTAEGFFLISGIVLGIVRGRKLLHMPFRDAAKLLLVRGVQLYAVSIILMLAFTFIGWFFMGNPGLKPGIRPSDQPLLEIIIGALSFEYIYGWADFLRLYTIFLIMSPFALWLLRKGKWYIALAGSIALWALYPYALETSRHSGEILMILSWQLIFFVGLIIGFHWQDLTKWWESRSKTLRRNLLVPVLVTASVTLTANSLLVLLETLGIAPAFAQTIQDQLAPIFNKEQMTLARILLFGIWFILGFYIFHRYEAWIVKWFGWILLPFGANSLYVYIMHAVLLFFAHLIMSPEAGTNIVLNTVGSCAIVLLILIAVYRKFLFKIIPR